MYGNKIKRIKYNNRNNGKFILFGESFEFGKFNSDIVRKHIEEKKVFWFTCNKTLANIEFDINEERVEKPSDKF